MSAIHMTTGAHAAGAHMAGISLMTEKPSAHELAIRAATELRERIGREAVRTKAEARRAARRITKRVTTRFYKRGTEEYEYVRRVCREIAEGFTGSSHYEKRGRRF